MVAYGLLLPAILLAAEPPVPPAETEEVAREPETGAGVSPVELIPRVELRQVIRKFDDGTIIQGTTIEMDIQFLDRVLLRYEGPVHLVRKTDTVVAGMGDTRLLAIGTVASDARRMAVIVVGAVLNTASQPQLGAGKQQIIFGGGAAFKPVRWWLPFALVQEQISVAGDHTRPDVNQAAVDAGSIFFGRNYNWLKADLIGQVDFAPSSDGRLFGALEVGSLVIGRVGLFVRASTQLAGPARLDYSLEAGARYLFRLERGKPR